MQIAALRHRGEERRELRRIVDDRVEVRGGARFGRQRRRRHRTRRQPKQKKKNGSEDASHVGGFVAGSDFLLREARPMLTLITGPVRSGKSSFALELARESERDPIYVATAEVDPDDAEMRDRVARHRAERGAMRTVETNERDGPRLVDTLRAAAAGEIAVVDSLGTWAGSRLVAHADSLGDDALALAGAFARDADDLLAAFDRLTADVIVVAEETGWGVVPPSPLGRAFRDGLGRLTATLAGRAGRAYLVVAGYAIDLRASGRRVIGR